MGEDVALDELMFPCPHCGKSASRVAHFVPKAGQAQLEGEGLRSVEIERVEKTDRWLCLNCLAGSTTPARGATP